MPSEESREVACLAVISDARAGFFDSLCAHTVAYLRRSKTDGKSIASLWEELIPLIRSENTYQIAQFLFLITHLGLNTKSKFGLLIDRHNHDMMSLLNDRDKMKTQGLNVQRIKSAIFSTSQKQKILDTFDERIHLDQSDIAKFMAPFMAAETCRTVIVALEEAGLLLRRGGLQKIIHSQGDLERYFQQHLQLILTKIAG